MIEWPSVYVPERSQIGRQLRLVLLVLAVAVGCCGSYM